MYRLILCVVIVAGMIGGIGSIAAADPPPLPTGAGNDLSENETATLWSKAPDDCSVDSNTNETAMQSLGQCADITFKEPPDTAARWTAYDFMTLDPGDGETSVYPDAAERTNSTFIKDAHATVYGVQPSTVVHRDGDSTLHYVAPEGQLRAFVDYRVEAPRNESEELREVDWSVVDHDISEVRLLQDDDPIYRTFGQHTPVIDYELAGQGATTLTVEADIEAELEQEVTLTGINETYTERTSEEVTVSQDLDAQIYDLTAEIYHADYPDEDDGVAIYQSQPWDSYQLTDDGEDRVRGVWRYYTARDTGWDYLSHSNRTDTETTYSDARPVQVHAFPSAVGPRAEPIRYGPEIQEVWGSTSSSPEPTLHENVNIGIVEESYTRSYGLAVRYDDPAVDELTVHGVVRGETAELVEPEEVQEREVRRSTLTAEVIEESDSSATVRIELRDESTGEPIVLESPYEDDPRIRPIGGSSRDGYVSVGDQRVRTNSSGMVVVTLDEPDAVTAQYHPGSWRTHEPAYLGDRTSVGWHPLSTAAGWLSILIDILWLFIPFLVAPYAGLRLGAFLQIPEDNYP